MSVTGSGSPLLPCHLATNWRFLCPPLLRFENLPKWITYLRKTLCLHFLVYYKGCKWTSDEKVHRVTSGRVPSTGASIPVESRCAALPAHGVFANLEVHQVSLVKGFYWAQCPATYNLPEVSGWGLKFWPPNFFAFLVICPIWGSVGAPPWITH